VGLGFKSGFLRNVNDENINVENKMESWKDRAEWTPQAQKKTNNNKMMPMKDFWGTRKGQGHPGDEKTRFGLFTSVVLK